jgi:DNA mismatch repair protein MutL
MSHVINILPQATANKIAAGEVVQRPASAVKELIENSIDAGATTITVVVKEGGKSLIQVIDNGSGMGAEDALLAFERHATSKISRDEDLENIRSLGFRGEALASISAVAQVELRTRLAGTDVGTKVRVEGGALKENRPEATAPGSVVTVKNLFFNTPARRKFLKSTPTEYKHLSDVVQRAALAYPSVGFTFISEEETILDVRPSTPEERVSEIFGVKTGKSLLAFAAEQEGCSVSGFLGKPEFARKGRAEQYLFMNTRPIINRAINHAVVRAYEHLIEKGSFPLFIVYLTVDPQRVDVNVHPSKQEVKFEDESAMYRFVFAAVRDALSGSDLIPDVRTRPESPGSGAGGFHFERHEPVTGQRIRSWEELIGRPDEGAASPFPSPQASGTPGSSPAEGIHIDDANGGTTAAWQLHNKYIIVPVDSGMMIVDQHAAHERIIYEKTIARFEESHNQSQQLLFPQTIQVSPGDAGIVKELLPLLEGVGFSLRFFGATTILLDGVPVDVKPGSEGTILQDILNLYREDDQKLSLEPRERLAKSYSCRAAVKAGDPLNPAEIRSLLDQLFATKIPYVCPHGRPVLIRFTLPDLDKRFGRTS